MKGQQDLGASSTQYFHGKTLYYYFITQHHIKVIISAKSLKEFQCSTVFCWFPMKGLFCLTQKEIFLLDNVMG